MLIAGRSFTEPAGLLPSSLPRITLPRALVVGAGQAHQAHQRRVADDVFDGGVARLACGLLAAGAIVAGETRHAACDNPRPRVARIDSPGVAKSVDAADSKSAGARRAGSIPASGTTEPRSSATPVFAPTNSNSRMPPLPPVTQALLLINVGDLLPAVPVRPLASTRLFALWPLGARLPAVAGRDLRLPARQLRPPVLQHARPVDVRRRARARLGRRSASCSSTRRACWRPR